MKLIVLPVAIVCAWAVNGAINLAFLIGCLLWPTNFQSPVVGLQNGSDVQLGSYVQQAQPTKLQIGENVQ